jgi:arylformamidase
MEIFDISRSLSDDLAPWPGDTPFCFELKWKMAEGASVNVGAINMSVHNGTHADAPFHFESNGAPIDRVPLEAYLGPAVVVDLTHLFGGLANGEITIADLETIASALEQAPRLLLKTGVWKDSKSFPDKIPVMASGVVDWLRDQKVKLLGLDLPSVDPIDAKKLSNHYALGAARIAIIESLDLSRIEPGIYNFSALPLKITGSDAGPVRAVLWRD